MDNPNIKAIYKPRGMTSHDVINILRKQTGEKKIGHAGTLDPLAAGVLIVGIGRDGTKGLTALVGSDKEYIAEIKLGETSTTDDAEGEKTKVSDNIPTEEEVLKVSKNYIGKIRQIPPAYSAAKVRGVRAYKRARAKEVFNVGGHDIEIKSIDILEYKYPIIKINTVTGSGAYIRSLARDIGKELGTGGYLKSLVRTRVGDFKIEDSEKLTLN